MIEKIQMIEYSKGGYWVKLNLLEPVLPPLLGGCAWFNQAETTWETDHGIWGSWVLDPHPEVSSFSYDVGTL
jgi:hypothetical protein